jgi:hypothetical protein
MSQVPENLHKDKTVEIQNCNMISCLAAALIACTERLATSGTSIPQYILRNHVEVFKSLIRKVCDTIDKAVAEFSSHVKDSFDWALDVMLPSVRKDMVIRSTKLIQLWMQHGSVFGVG